MKITEHPVVTASRNQWRYFMDQYEGGPAYCQKSNPLAVAIPVIAGQSGNAGASHYLIQQGLESQRNYAIRLNETPSVPICSQVVDFYASTVGGQENITIEAPDAFLTLLDNCDLQGQSLTQFMQQCRVDASIYGHTFVVIDMLRAQTEIVTQADVQASGVRPYVYEIEPPNMFNWRFGGDGTLIEAIYRVALPEAESVLADEQPDQDDEYLYWSQTEWKRLRLEKNTLAEVEGGPNPTGIVPIACLYHKRIGPFEGESLIANAAHMQHTAVNWLSDMLQNLRMTMYAQPVLKSDRTIDQVAVGAAALMQLSPDNNEDFAFVTPDASPFAEAWAAWEQFCERATMGLKYATATKTAESGVSKAWDYHEASKVMARMALHEQEAVKQILDIAGKWMGVEFDGTVQYATTFDLASAEDDLAALIAMQAAQVPTAAQREVMRRVIGKMLPSLPPDTQTAITKELDAWRITEAPKIPPAQ